MASTRIYMDNAATSFPKPTAVLAAMIDYANQVGASAGRGAYREAIESGRIIFECRQRIATLLNAPDPDHIIFTLNCTDGLNMGLHGLLRQGDHVVTTCMDHNSVLRPLNHLKERMGLAVTFVSADPETSLVDPAAIEAAMQPNTRLVAVVHGSNVTGSLQPIDRIGAIAKAHGAVYLVDAAQSVGHVPLDVQALGVDILACPGHKGLLGPLGTGVLYLSPGVVDHVLPLKQGGTGSVSEVPVQPDFMPDRYESGSHNAIGIAGLSAGVGWLLERGVESLHEQDMALCAAFLEMTSDIAGLRVFGPKGVDGRVGVFSVRIDGYEPAELSAMLESEFGVLTRCGLHCAPYAHRTIGTLDDGGTTRLSFGPFVTADHVAHAVDALRQLARSSAAAGL